NYCISYPVFYGWKRSRPGILVLHIYPIGILVYTGIGLLIFAYFLMLTASYFKIDNPTYATCLLVSIAAFCPT
ncbi:hypothetical protein KKC82_03060, partial [bacterium]|nr:hypothetical protein [bacterium]